MQDIYDIKPTDMIYKKEYKEKNKNKAVCEKVPPEKSIEMNFIQKNRRLDK